MLAIICIFEEYKHYLKGYPKPVEIWSNHLNLTYFHQAQKLLCRQAHWALFFTCFNFSLHHKLGKTILHADPLSRRPDHEEGVMDDNASHTLLKLEFFAIKAM